MLLSIKDHRQYQKLFELDDQNLTFSKEALLEIVREARRRKTGARALRAIVEERLMETMYELPERKDVEVVCFTRANTAA